MTCLETSFLIDLVRGSQEIVELKNELNRSEARLTIASPSLMELWSGALLRKVSDAQMHRIAELATAFQILPFDAETAKEAGEIEAALIKKGMQIQTEDIMIAAIAMTHGEKLVTRDSDFARIDGLRLLKY